MRIGIVTGGSINESFVNGELSCQQFDKLIAVDHGADFFLKSEFAPDFIVGDFDSVKKDTIEILQNRFKVKIDKHPSEKDETDTELAISMAIGMGAKEIIIYGATGTRMDHVLGNIQLLKKSMEHKVICYIQDEFNRIQMVDHSIQIRKDEQYGYYVSLIPFTPVVTGITLKGMKYPLKDYDLHSGIARCVSNEIQEEKGEILFRDGILLIIESKKD